MICEHLRDLETAILAAGMTETWRGSAWTHNCREWVYFNCFFDLPRIRHKYRLPRFVQNHVNNDVRTGLEQGLVCMRCFDAVVGFHPREAHGKKRFPVAK